VNRLHPHLLLIQNYSLTPSKTSPLYHTVAMYVGNVHRIFKHFYDLSLFQAPRVHFSGSITTSKTRYLRKATINFKFYGNLPY